MTLLHAFLLGIIEGITEFLPISSTGHLILTQALLHIPQTEFAKLFDVVIQLAAMIAVVGIYIRYLIAHSGIIKKLFVAFLPTGIIGLTLYKIVKQYFLGNVPLTIGALLIGGIILIVFEGRGKKEKTKTITQLSYKESMLIGLAQSVSIIPGVSRAAATIIGGLSIGLTREEAVQFSFLLAIPTMAAATGLDLLKNYSLLTSTTIPLLAVGFLTAGVTAWIAITWFLAFIKTHSLRSFGIYRIVLALVLSALLLYR
jgi:undecaprenyl-diphosphatase